MTFAKTVVLIVVLTLWSTATVSGQTVTAFKTGERTTGMTKQCFYDALGSEYTRTVKSYAICPISIKVRSGGR